MGWLVGQGYSLYLPLGHSPDVDLIAERNGTLMRVQVKTTVRQVGERWVPMLCTKGGNQSWGGVVKRFAPDRCDALFVHVGDGRRWFMPATSVEGTTGISLGGSKYAEFEIEPGPPLATGP